MKERYIVIGYGEEGPAVYGLYSKKKKAERRKEALRSEDPRKVYSVEPVRTDEACRIPLYPSGLDIGAFKDVPVVTDGDIPLPTEGTGDILLCDFDHVWFTPDSMMSVGDILHGAPDPEKVLHDVRDWRVRTVIPGEWGDGGGPSER